MASAPCAPLVYTNLPQRVSSAFLSTSSIALTPGTWEATAGGWDSSVKEALIVYLLLFRFRLSCARPLGGEMMDDGCGSPVDVLEFRSRS